MARPGGGTPNQAAALGVQLRLFGPTLVAAAALACANIEPPPGGPPDAAPPVVLSTVPESLGVYPGFDESIEFRFNEVISEGTSPSMGLGTGDLERLILLSPGLEVPRVSWRRNRISVKPGEGWRRNTVYRVELKPGVADLSRNRSQESMVLTFATGGALPRDTITARVIDWEQGRPAAGALIMATLLPDSLVYRMTADSSGSAVFGPLPRGRYLVTAAVDQNGNDLLDRREAFDTVTLEALPAADLALWTFNHDSTGPRIERVTVRDSLSLVVSFTQSLEPGQEYGPDMVRLISLPDSSVIGVVSFLPPVVHDSVYRPPPDSAGEAPPDSVPPPPAQAAPDSGAVVPDTAAAEPDPLTVLLATRPPLLNSLMIRTSTPLARGSNYFLELYRLRNVAGATSDTAGIGFQYPALPPPPPVADSAAVDSTPAPPDSVAAPQDSAGPGGPRR